MKKRAFLFICLLFVWSNIFSKSTLEKQVDTLKQTELNRYKTLLEIKKIKTELESKDDTSWLQTGTFLTAILALIISIITSNRSNKRQIESQISNNEHNQKDRVSNLLKELGSDSLSVKIAATQALSEYKSAIPFIINSLRIEQNQLLIDVVIKVLSKEPELSILYLLEETRTIQNKKLDAGGKLVALGLDRKIIASELSIDNGDLFNWIENKYGSRIQELTDIRIKNKTIASGKTDDEIRDDEKKSIYKYWEKLIIDQHNIITSIEEVIKESVRLGLKLKLENACLDGIMLVNTNLSGYSFKNCMLNNANFEGSDFTRVDFSNIKARFLNMKNCVTTDTIFDNSILKYCDFRNAKGKRISIQNSELFEPNFDGSNLKYANFNNSKLIKMSFKNTIFVKGSFNNGVFHECDLSATDLTESQFFNSRIISSKFITTRVRKANFQKCELIRTEIIKSSFDESNMSFCILKNIKSIDSQFTKVNFVGAQFTEVTFDNQTKIDGIETSNMSCVNCSSNLTSLVDKT